MAERLDSTSADIQNGYSILGAATTADDFVLASNAAIASVGFYFQNYNGITGWNQDVTYAILADNAGPFGSVLASGAGQNVSPVDSGLPWCCRGGNAWLVTFDLQSPFSAAAGTRYWLQLSGATGSASSAWWVTAPNNGTPLAFSLGSQISNQLAFYLDDTGGVPQIPEPASALLMGAGFLALAARRHYRR